MPISPPYFPSFDGDPDFSNQWVLMDPQRILSLSKTGSAWDAIATIAGLATTATVNSIILGDKDDTGCRYALASVIYAIGTDTSAFVSLAYAMLQTGVGTHNSAVATGGNNESGVWGRNLQAYIGAWDLVQRAGDVMSTPVALGAAATFTINQWISDLYDTTIPAGSDKRTMKEIAEERPMNLGSHARAGAAAMACYFKSAKQLRNVARSYVAWAGDLSSPNYTLFKWNSNDSFQVGQSPPYYGIVPKDKWYDVPFSGTSLWTASGCQPEEARRNTGCYGATFHWNPPDTTYYWEGLQGAAVCAHLLASHGYGNAWRWQDQAINRAFLFNFDIPRECTSAGQSTTDTQGIIPTAEDAPLARIINGIFQAAKDASIPATYTAMKGVVGLDWYLGV